MKPNKTSKRAAATRNARPAIVGLDMKGIEKWAEAQHEARIRQRVSFLAAIDSDRVREIRKKHASSTKEFEENFGIPARTIEGWEQGRKIDMAARILLCVIESEAEAVGRAIDRK